MLYDYNVKLTLYRIIIKNAIQRKIWTTYLLQTNHYFSLFFISNIEIAKVCQTSLCKFAPPDVTEIFIKCKVSVSRKKR